MVMPKVRVEVVRLTMTSAQWLALRWRGMVTLVNESESANDDVYLRMILALASSVTAAMRLG